jgi:Spy/CpxP family protein refolding chaperone
MRNIVIKNLKLTRRVLLAAFAISMHSSFAQQPALPSGGMQSPSSASLPQRNVDTEVSMMTKRYGLSNDQATKLRAILNEEQQKAEAILKDSSVSPQDLFSKIKLIREDETTRVSAILTPEQRTKYESDMKQMQSPPSQAPGGFPPPPPGFQGAGPTGS